ncbi:Palmitoyl-protein thioesterase 1 [Massospora cicadina]|nr:Palmitoyl-protein thioesterase 1 [Massospora cicadina]
MSSAEISNLSLGSPISAENKQLAESLKHEANATLNEDWEHTKKFDEAIEKYSEAIKLNPGVPAYYSNRAFAYTKVEAYGYAIKDAESAIELDSSFAKIVRRIEFEKAIRSDQAKRSVADTIDLETMTIEPSYDGAKLGEEGMTEDFILDMVERFKAQRKIHKKYAYMILLSAKKMFADEPTLVDVSIPEDARLTVCGDTHAYKLLYPKSVYLNRGNHETDNMNKVYGFEGEVKAKYPFVFAPVCLWVLFALFSETFKCFRWRI